MPRELNGVFRATVMSDISQDPEGRMRVRINCPAIHTPDMVESDLPFAEACQDVGQMRGKFFPFRTADLVWVMFEGGEYDKPVIVGGQINVINQVPDLPIEMQVDQSGEVVVEVDDAGNTIIRDGRWDKRKLTFRSGGAEVEITSVGDKVMLNAVSGSVEINAGNAIVNAGTVSVDAATVNISAQSTDVFEQDNGRITESANDEINRTARATFPLLSNVDPNPLAQHGIINDGGDVPKVRGIPVPPGIPRQSNKHNLRSRIINIGVGPTGFIADPLGGDATLSPFIDYNPNVSEAAAATATGSPSVPFPLLPTLEVNIRSSVAVRVAAPSVLIGGSASVTLMSQALMSLTALANLSITSSGRLSVVGLADVEVMALGAATVDVGGAMKAIVGGALSATVGGAAVLEVGGNLTASAGGTASITVGGALTLFAGGTVDVMCGGAVSLEAPTINLVGSVFIAGPLMMGGPIIGMTGVLFDTHMHPYIDITLASPGTVPSVTLPPLPG